MTVHFIYANGFGIDTATSIAREVPQRLSEHYKVEVHHPNDPTTIRPEPGDILIGHPNRHGPCVFRRSFGQPGWARRIVFAPFSHGLLEDAAAVDALVGAADLYLAITGSYWFDSVPDSPVSHWRHKMLRCDLGVNRNHFPQIKTRFNDAGRRRFVYIGNADPMKGGDFLAKLANANPGLELGWICASNSRHCLDSVEMMATLRLDKIMKSSRLIAHPGIPWRRPEGMQVVATYDMLLNCGRSDAMPSEVLEGASWGLVPVTTPQCGFPTDEWMTHLPLDDLSAASAVLHELNACDDAELRARQTAGWRRLDERYNWDRVASQVRNAIEAPVPAEPVELAWQARRRKNQRFLRRLLLQARWRDNLERTVHKIRYLPQRFLGNTLRNRATGI